MLAPEHGPNHAVLGEVLYHLGRLHSAEVVAAPLHRARLHRRPRDLDAARQQPTHARRPRRGARDARARARAVAAAAPAAHSNVGVVLTQLGRFDEAIEHFHQAIAARAREQRRSTATSATRCSPAGRLAEAFEPWERAIQGGPRGQRARRTRAALDARRHRRARARVPRAGRRRRDPVRVVLSRPHRRRARRRDRVRHAARAAVRPLVPRPPRCARRRIDDDAPARRCTTSTARSRRAACSRCFRPTLDALPRPARRSSSPIPSASPRGSERLAEIGPGPVRRHVVAQPS